MKSDRPLAYGVRRKRFIRQVRQRLKKHRRRNGQQKWPSTETRFSGEPVRVTAPAEISIKHYAKRRAVMLFCRKIRETYLQKGQSVILDFSMTRQIASAGMLLVVAEIDRAQRLGSAKQRFICKLPEEQSDETRIVRQVLDQVDLLERTGHPQVHPDKSDFDQTVRHWRYATGTRVDEEPGDVLEQHEGRIAPALMEKMQIGLMEALTNSLHHAYRAARNDGCSLFNERRWWMFTHELDGRLQVLVVDLGIGISRSLPLVWGRDFVGKLRALLAGVPKDVAAIKIALALGQTSTKEKNRGKGMHQIWNALHESDVGGVEIFSGKGHLGYDAENGNEFQGEFDTPLLGTMIAWTVSISGAARESDG